MLATQYQLPASLKVKWRLNVEKLWLLVRVKKLFDECEQEPGGYRIKNAHKASTLPCIFPYSKLVSTHLSSTYFSTRPNRTDFIMVHYRPAPHNLAFRAWRRFTSFAWLATWLSSRLALRTKSKQFFVHHDETRSKILPGTINSTAAF